MKATRWVLVGLVSLLIAGCASPTLLPPTPTVTPTCTSTPTVTPSPTSTAVPTSTRSMDSGQVRPAPLATATPRPAITPTPVPTKTSTSTPAPEPTPTEVAGGLSITILYDNNEYDERLETAWGFSCLVEGADKRHPLEKTILFDTGGDSAMLLRNMRTLGITPQDVDVVVISHVHGDHVGGLSGFLKENHDVTVYLPQSLPQSFKDVTRDAGAELVEVHGPLEICEHVRSTGELGDGIKEQSLLIETARGLVVITGCAHPGVVNIVRRAKELTGGEVYLVLGGFHLGGTSEAKIAAIVEDFRQLGVQKAAPCHCSGDVARRLFGEVYGEDFIPAGVGSRLEARY
jgi:7,8-dihydropterin-6-yl-methyl-4-(beta-D-ribofuranosyl)aminobenzene 5'-phosphate synthase